MAGFCFLPSFFCMKGDTSMIGHIRFYDTLPFSLVSWHKPGWLVGVLQLSTFHDGFPRLGSASS